MPYTLKMERLFHLLQMSDSTFPTGAFSFSVGLESAVTSGLITDSDSLKQYVRSMIYQSATTDGVAALNTYRATKSKNYSFILDIDTLVMLSKLNEETRIMQQRMGKKLIELACKIFPTGLLMKFLADIQQDITKGSYVVAQGISFAELDLSEIQLFVSQQYGVANMILSASLRCCKVTHYETQQILYDISESISKLYEDIKGLTINDMHSFIPEADVFASLHEKGKIRMFMN
jgi:urease accessory protein